MKLVFVSNFINIHQIPLCEEFYKLLGEDFIFIETTPVDANRIEMGFDRKEYKYTPRI